MHWWLRILVVAGLLAGACGSTVDQPQRSDAPQEQIEPVDEQPDQVGAVSELATGELPFGLRRCDPEPDWATADPALYRDAPVYVGNEMPTDEVRDWAQSLPGYEEIWIDRAHNGWVTVGFSEGADERQAEIVALFPDDGVVAVHLDWTREEIETLQQQVFAVVPEASGGASVPSGVVDIWVGVLDEEHLAPLAEFAGPRLCVNGDLPEDAIVAGPQPTEGDGWRLLGSDRTGLYYRTGVGTTDSQYEELWDLAGLTGDRPAVNFESEIVIWFGAVYGSTCDIRMDAVVFDGDHSVVHGDFVIPESNGECTDDANPKAYVVAVERTNLPGPDFVVQLNKRDPYVGAREERTHVTVDLREPGATAFAMEMGFDEAFISGFDRPYVMRANGIIEPGETVLYDLDLHCSFGFLGPFNSVYWQSVTDGLEDNPPVEWSDLATENGIVETSFLMEIEPARLSLSAGGHTENYLPAPNGLSDCR